MNNEKLPPVPQNPEAERNLLGVVFVAPARLGEAAETGVADDFFQPLHRKIFSAMLRLADEGKAIEELTVAAVLGEDADFKAAGGIAYLSKLGDGVHTKAPMKDYCRLVKESARARRLRWLFDEAARNVEPGRTSDVVTHVESELSAFRDDEINGGRGAVHISEVVREVAPVLDRVGSGQGVMLGAPTGFSDLDKLTAGWVAGEMVLLAGRPSSGKTALALELALRQAQQGNAVGVFSLEMSRSSVLLRLVCREARVSYHAVCSGYMSRTDASALCAVIPAITALPIWIDDRPAVQSHDLRWRLRALARRQQIKLCIVDYLQLLRAKAENRVQEITKVSLDLKAAARELGELAGGTLLAAAQLNRAGANERPRLHHLRESGQLEQDADAVMLLSDEREVELGQANPSVKLLDVAKQRNGPTGIVRLMFLPIVMGFEQAEPHARDVHDGKAAGAGA